MEAGALTVGADPAGCVVILQLAYMGDFANIVLTPDEAQRLAAALVAAAEHLRSCRARRFDAVMVSGHRGRAAVRRDSGSAEIMLMGHDGAHDRLFEVPVTADIAQQNAVWLEQAAAAMRAQQSGEIDQRVLFSGQRVGQA